MISPAAMWADLAPCSLQFPEYLSPVPVHPFPFHVQPVHPHLPHPDPHPLHHQLGPLYNDNDKIKQNLMAFVLIIPASFSNLLTESISIV